MRLFACIALVLGVLLGLSACQDAPGDAYDNAIHNGYPGPAPRDKNS